MHSRLPIGVALQPVWSHLCRYTQRTSTIAERLNEEWYSPTDVQKVSTDPPVLSNLATWPCVAQGNGSIQLYIYIE